MKSRRLSVLLFESDEKSFILLDRVLNLWVRSGSVPEMRILHRVSAMKSDISYCGLANVGGTPGAKNVVFSIRIV